MTKKTLVLFILVFMLAVGMASPTFARRGGDRDRSNETSQSSDDSDSNDTEDETEVEDENEVDEDEVETESHHSREDRLQRFNERIAERRNKLEQKFEERKAKRQEKLEGKRLDICEKRETRINELLQSSAEHAKKKLAVFQRIEEGVKNFYVEKDLNADGYDAAVTNADEKEAAAIAAIDAMAGISFSCDEADGSNPGAVISEAAHARHDALREYKQAVRQLIVVVKKALELAETSTPEATENETESVQ